MLRLLRKKLGPQVIKRFQSGSSVFQDISGSGGELPSTTTQGPSAEYNSNKDLQNHPYIYAKLNPSPQKTIDLLSPLKRKLYELNLQANGGIYKNNQVMSLDGKQYRLNLPKDIQKALEPSVFCQSYRIKGSWKKTYMFLRIFRRLPLNDAITQCHFSSRRMAQDVGEMLTRGSKDAVKMGINPSSLIVHSIWVGKDGNDEKRLQCKGRGRTGIITSPYVHVKAILKPEILVDQRKEWIKQRLDKKLWFPLTNWKIKEDYVQTANYKW